MSNMNYCKYTNTLADLAACKEAMFESEELSPEETQARQQLIIMCHSIAGDTEDEYEKILEARKQKRLKWLIVTDQERIGET